MKTDRFSEMGMAACRPAYDTWLAKMRKGTKKRWDNMSAAERKKEIAKMQASRVNGAAHAVPHDAPEPSPIPHAQSLRRSPLPHSHRGGGRCSTSARFARC
jgi:hypothetical protein